MELGYPFRIDGTGRTAFERDINHHIRDLIEQVLFTDVGERVNRPDFGSTLRQMVFASNSDETIAATQFLVQGALQRWLGNLIEVEAVDVTPDDNRLQVVVTYLVRRTQAQQIAEFSQ